MPIILRITLMALSILLLTVPATAQENILVADTSGPDISIYPIPSSGSMTIHSSQIISSIKIFNLLGSEMHSQPVNSADVSFSQDQLPDGVYFFHFTFSHGEWVKKMLIQH